MQRHSVLLPCPVLRPPLVGPCFISPPVNLQTDDAAALNLKETCRRQASTRNPIHTSEVVHLQRARMKMESLNNHQECCQCSLQQAGDDDISQRQQWQVERQGGGSTKNHQECCKMLQDGDNSRSFRPCCAGWPPSQTCT